MASLLKRKGIRVLLILFSLWLIITLYYYSCHVINIDRHIIDEKIEWNDAIIEFEELVLCDAKNKDRMNDGRWETTWNIASKLPTFLQRPFLEICYFYYNPYLENEYYDDKFAYVEMRGRIITKNKDGNKINNIFDSIFLRDNTGRGYSKKRELCQSDSSNISYFYIGGDIFSRDFKEVYVGVKDETGKALFSVPIKPDWQRETYNFFKKKPTEYYFLDPANTVSEFIKNRDKESYKDYIYEEVEAFPWENMDHEYWKKDSVYIIPEAVNYLGEYKEFADVYVTRIKFKEDEIKIGQQDIYLIDTGKKFKIIDISPLIKM